MRTLAELQGALGCGLRGDGDTGITGVGSVECAGPGEIAPVDNARFLDAARASRAGAFLVADTIDEDLGRSCLVSKFPLADFNRVIDAFGLTPPGHPRGVHPTAVLAPGAEIGPDLIAGPYAVVEASARIGARCVLYAHAWIEGGAVLGDDCVLEPGAAIFAGARIGDRVQVGAHAAISRQGFGYAPGPDGPVRLHHVGTVVIEDDVHVGAGVMVDRARFDVTRVGRHSKLDNLVHLGHNATIGVRTFVAAQTGLAGNAKVGDDCEVGGQVGIANHCGVGNRCRVAAKTGFFRMYPDDTTVMGYPSHERGEFLRQQAVLRRLAKKRAE